MSNSTKDDVKAAGNLNDQIKDSAAQIHAMVNNVSGDFSKGVEQQIKAHAIGLAMQNAVAQQQEQYVLRNAIVTAAAKAILESSPKDAIALAETALSGNDIVSTITGLKDLLDDVTPNDKGNTSKPAKKAS